MAYPRVYAATLGIEALDASTPYVLVDLSDTTNFPHNGTAEIILCGLALNAEKASDGQFDIWVGVVIENDGTDGTAKWIHCFHLESVVNPTDSTDRRSFEIDFSRGSPVPGGLDLKVTSGALVYVVTNLSQASHANWKNDTNRVSPVGATTKPGVGDLVVWVEETGGTGTIDFCLTALYRAV